MTTIAGSYSARPAYSIRLDVTLYEQDIPNNRSRFNYRLYIRHDTSASNGTYANTARAYAAFLDGVTIASGSHNFLMGPSGDYVGKEITIASGITGWFDHDPDGTIGTAGSVAISAYHNMSPDIMGNASASGSHAVPTIPRATVPTVSPVSGNTGATYTINHTPAASTFYHDIAYSLDGGSTWTNIITNLAGTDTSTDWTPAHTLLPNTTSVTAIIRVITRDSSGGTIIGTETVNLPLTVPATVKPTISSVTWVDDQTSGPDMPTLMGGAGRFVQRWSKLKPTVASAGASGSTVTDTDVSQGGQTTDSGVAFGLPVATSGAVPFTAIATDSRTRVSDTFIDTVAVTAYNYPSLPTPTIVRTSDAGGTTPSPVGTYLRITPAASVSSINFSGEKNLLEYQIRSRLKGGSWSVVQAWTAVGVVGTTWTTPKMLSGYLSSAEYEVEVSIRDLFGKNGFATASTVKSVAVPIPSESVHMNWTKDGVAFGRYHQGIAFVEVGGDVQIDDNLNVDGDVDVLNTLDVAGDIQKSGVTILSPTETRPGIAEIANQAETDAGVDDVRYVTPLKLKTYLYSEKAVGAVAADWTVGKPDVTITGIGTVSAFLGANDIDVQPGATVSLTKIGSDWIIDGVLNSGPKYPKWVPITPGSGWAWGTGLFYVGGQGNQHAKPSVSRTAYGYVEVKGNMQRTSAAAANSVIATLPVGFRPLVAQRFAVWSAGTTLGVEVQTNGNIIALMTTGTDVYLDGIRFNNDPALTWTNITYLNGFNDFNSPTIPGGQYAKDAIGRVYYRGQVKGGSAAPMQTIPAALRQNAALGTNITFGLWGVGTMNRMDIQTASSQLQEVYSTTGAGASSLAIDPVTWLADGFSVDPELAASYNYNSVGYHVFNFNAGGDYGGGFTGRRVTKTADGMVKMAGLIQSVGIGGVIMYLPKGMRPSGVRQFPTEMTDNIGLLYVLPNGAVIPAAGSTTWISLDGIQFLAEQ